jgi:hypothetical protein
MAHLTIVIVKPRKYIVKILGTWKGIDKLSLRSIATRAWHKSKANRATMIATSRDVYYSLRLGL